MDSLFNNPFTDNNCISIFQNMSIQSLTQKIENIQEPTIIVLKKEKLKILKYDQELMEILKRNNRNIKIKKLLKTDAAKSLDVVSINKTEVQNFYSMLLQQAFGSDVCGNNSEVELSQSQNMNFEYNPPVGSSSSGNENFVEGGTYLEKLFSDVMPTVKPYFIVSEFFEQVNLGSLLEIKVFLSRIAGKKSSIELWLQEEWKIEILVVPKSGFDLPNDFLQSIVVKEENLNKPLNFILKPSSIGQGSFIIMARYQGIELFQTEYRVTIIPVNDCINYSNIKQQSILKGKPQNLSPDLTLLIIQTIENSRLILKYFLHSPDETLNLNYKSFKVEIHQPDLGNYFLDFFNGIDGLSQDTKQQRLDTIDKLKAKGATLYKDLFPEELRRIFWSIHDKIKSIVINSDEPWVPWEICFMYSDEEGIETGKFLCESYEISRWISGSYSPTEEIKIANAAFVIPDSNLVCPPNEKEQIVNLFHQKNTPSTEISATYSEVRKSFLSGDYNIWHFSGHGTDSNGTNSDGYKIILNENSSFSPNDITGMKSIGKGKPIIFFNACQASKPGLGLTGLSGWPKQFIDNNASAFIGAYWSVNDETASKLAVKFYELLLSGETIASALKNARLFVKDEGNPTWLAYTLYADPFARIVIS